MSDDELMMFRLCVIYLREQNRQIRIRRMAGNTFIGVVGSSLG